MKRAAFTLVEVLAALSIIVVLVAFLTPVFRGARERALIQSSLSQLRQIHIAVTLYRNDWDAGGYSQMYSAGLPPYSYVYGTYMGLGPAAFRSPCGYKSTIEPNQSRLSVQYAPSPWSLYSDYLSTYQESALLANDPHCNPADVIYDSPFTKKRGLGVLLSGRLINQYKLGFPGDLRWWTP